MSKSSSRTPVSRREARKQDRREAIVAAARQSFLADGYAAMSMSGLLKAIGGSKATLWGYFRSKEELFAAVIEDVTSAVRRELESGLLAPADLETTLVTFCRSFLGKTSNPDVVATWRLIIAESGRFPELGRIFYERAASHVERALSAYLAQQIAAGRLRDEGATKMAQVLIGMCATQHNRRLLGITSGTPEEVEADAARYANYFLRLFSPVEGESRRPGPAGSDL